jgi:putative glutamine amidotransferase
LPVRILVAGSADRSAYLAPYFAALLDAGAEPVLAWPDEVTRSDRAAFARFLEGFAGLLLPGGKDVEPWRYGEQTHPMLGETDRELDDGELALARLAFDEGLPTLAICRGIQVIGVAVGATLYQDLPSQRPDGLEHRVRATPATLAHDVEVTAGSRLGRAVGQQRFPVNSRHHQAVRADSDARVGDLQIVARSPDGVVEGLEAPDHRFFVGVQWHPENLVAELLEARRLFRGFVEACAG